MKWESIQRRLYNRMQLLRSAVKIPKTEAILSKH